MPLSVAKIEDNTLGGCRRYRLLSPSIFFYLLLSSIILSCTDGTVLHSYKPLPADGWDKRDTICFDVPKAEKNINGLLFIGLRTKAVIGIQDITLAVEQYGETTGLIRQDTIRYPLTDAEGNALSKGVNCHQYETIHLPIQIKKGQNGSVRVHHLMTREMITGITEIGIKISRH